MNGHPKKNRHAICQRWKNERMVFASFPMKYANRIVVQLANVHNLNRFELVIMYIGSITHYSIIDMNYALNSCSATARNQNIHRIKTSSNAKNRLIRTNVQLFICFKSVRVAAYNVFFDPTLLRNVNTSNWMHNLNFGIAWTAKYSDRGSAIFRESWFFACVEWDFSVGELEWAEPGCCVPFDQFSSWSLHIENYQP